MRVPHAVLHRHDVYINHHTGHVGGQGAHGLGIGHSRRHRFPFRRNSDSARGYGQHSELDLHGTHRLLDAHGTPVEHSGSTQIAQYGRIVLKKTDAISETGVRHHRGRHDRPHGIPWQDRISKPGDSVRLHPPRQHRGLWQNP